MQLTLSREILKDLVCSAVVEVSKLVRIPVLVRAGYGRAAALNVTIVDEHNACLRQKDTMKSLKKITQPCSGHMRPPKSCQARCEFLRERGKVVSICSAEQDLAMIHVF